MSQRLPPDVQAFVTDHIDSIEQLEVLLLLCKEPERVWSLEQLSSELRGSPRSIRRRLDDLCAMKLAQLTTGTPDTFRYQPDDERKAATVAALAGLYRTYRVAITELIFRSSKSKMLTFARAFRIKGDDDGG